MTKEFDDKLDRTARQLATEISPERDLWPGIAEAITTPKRSRWTPMLAQAAAVVLLVGTSSAVTYIATKDSSGPVISVAPELVFEQAAFGGNYHLGPGFQDARNSLRDDLDVELARLSDEAREDVQANLDLIHQAIIDINKALEQEPDNVLLATKAFAGVSRRIELVAQSGWSDAQRNEKERYLTGKVPAGL